MERTPWLEPLAQMGDEDVKRGSSVFQRKSVFAIAHTEFGYEHPKVAVSANVRLRWSRHVTQEAQLIHRRRAGLHPPDAGHSSAP
jgi:hypothetical protein